MTIKSGDRVIWCGPEEWRGGRTLGTVASSNSSYYAHTITITWDNQAGIISTDDNGVQRTNGHKLARKVTKLDKALL